MHHKSSSRSARHLKVTFRPTKLTRVVSEIYANAATGVLDKLSPVTTVTGAGIFSS